MATKLQSRMPYDDNGSKESLTKKSLLSKGFYLGGLLFIAGLIYVGYQVYNAKTNTPKLSLNGQWNVTLTTTRTDHKPYHGMVLEFSIFLQELNGDISGQGEKLIENGQELSGNRRTQLELNGKHSPESIILNYKDFGLLRSSIGQITLKKTQSDNRLIGTFSTTAASSSGTAEFTR